MSPSEKIRPPQRLGVPETGRLIREARERAGLSLAALGDLAGFSAPTIGAWERGEREIGVSQILRLARALSVQAASLLPVESPFSLRERDRAREALRLLSVPREALTQAGRDVTRELAAEELRRALRGSDGGTCGLLCAECGDCECPGDGTQDDRCDETCHRNAQDNGDREREKAKAA